MIIKNQEEIATIYCTLRENLAILYNIKYIKEEIPTTDDYNNLDFLLRQYLTALLLDTDWFVRIPVIIDFLYEDKDIMNKFISGPFTKKSIVEYLTNLNIF